MFTRWSHSFFPTPQMFLVKPLPGVIQDPSSGVKGKEQKLDCFSKFLKCKQWCLLRGPAVWSVESHSAPPVPAQVPSYHPLLPQQEDRRPCCPTSPPLNPAEQTASNTQPDDTGLGKRFLRRFPRIPLHLSCWLILPGHRRIWSPINLTHKLHLCPTFIKMSTSFKEYLYTSWLRYTRFLVLAICSCSCLSWWVFCALAVSQPKACSPGAARRLCFADGPSHLLGGKL